MVAVSSPLKWHGGKSKLSSWILSLAPPHLHWVETHGGGLSVTLSHDPEGHSEVVNDRYGQLQNFWRVLQDEELFSRFQRRIEATPFSQIEWEEASVVNHWCGPGGDRVERAVAMFVDCRQSRAGQMQAFATLSRTRTRRNMNEQASAWLSAVEGLPEVHKRLQRIVILDDLATNVIKSQDGLDTLYYLDPPYVPESRVSKDVYAYEMTVEEHQELLTVLATIKGKFLLSGYKNDLYLQAERLHGWNRHEREIPNHAASGETKRMMIECIWTNF